MGEYKRKPQWLKIKLSDSKNFGIIKNLRKREGLHTVCEEARCPNIHECWGQRKTATFMILGDRCTRRCRFCAVKTGLPVAVDFTEPQRVAKTVSELGLHHAVITMVNRDDMDDGGARVMARTIYAIKKMSPATSIEVLTSDFMGKEESIRQVMEAKPNIFSHNLETVRRLTPIVRSRSDYDRSLKVLHYAAKIKDEKIFIKSGIMLGLGESKSEIFETMDDLLAHGVKMFNMGQYLQPSHNHLPVEIYRTPGEFRELKDVAIKKGFPFVESGPLVRSSYHAGDQYNGITASND